MTIAIDFDGTIHDTHNVAPGYKLGKPMPGAHEAMWQLHRAGHELIIFTVWGAEGERRLAIEKWLSFFNIPYKSITNIKPQADVYLDDKAYRYEGRPDSWDKFVKIMGA